MVTPSPWASVLLNMWVHEVKRGSNDYYTSINMRRFQIKCFPFSHWEVSQALKTGLFNYSKYTFQDASEYQNIFWLCRHIKIAYFIEQISHTIFSLSCFINFKHKIFSIGIIMNRATFEPPQFSRVCGLHFHLRPSPFWICVWWFNWHLLSLITNSLSKDISIPGFYFFCVCLIATT